MATTLTFYGAAQNVTGSRYLLEHDGKRVLVDCGYYQERNLKARNWEPFPFPAESIDAVLLTHAHLDHCGLLPKLVAAGFRGKICCTPATADIARIVLLDAAKIQEEDAEFKRLRHEREGRRGPHPEVPLYTTEDAKRVFSLFSPALYERPVSVVDDIEAVFTDAGHILGSSHVHVHVGSGGNRRHIVFSGDVGRSNVPIVRDPCRPEEADYVIMESTYGNRRHGATESIPEQLEEVINWTRERGGNLMIPSFAVERTQELLYHLGGLLREDRIPHLRAFVDSPMAVRVTEVFKRHPELMDEETLALIDQGKHPCDFPGLTMCRTVAESKSINHIKGTAIIIAGSGMCTGGRIKHHLAHNIDRPDSTLLFVGYQAVGTLGRIIQEGANPVRILGESHPVRARIGKIDGFSAHADQEELLAWVSNLKAPPRRVFVTHGEPDAATAFADLLHERTGWDAVVPSYEDSVTLD